MSNFVDWFLIFRYYFCLWRMKSAAVNDVWSVVSMFIILLYSSFHSAYTVYVVSWVPTRFWCWRHKLRRKAPENFFSVPPPPTSKPCRRLYASSCLETRGNLLTKMHVQFSNYSVRKLYKLPTPDKTYENHSFTNIGPALFEVQWCNQDFFSRPRPRH